MLEHLILNGRLQAAYHYHDSAPKNFKEELLTHFNKGKRKEFLKLFLLLPTEEKLEFYIRVYFLIYNIHPALKAKPSIPEDQISAFREYLDTKGADLAKTNEFLQFYALSYVKKPLEHPSYKSLFKREWVSNLTEKLQIFLQNEQKRIKESVYKEESDSKRMRSPQFVQPPQTSSVYLKSLEEKNKKLFQEVEVFKRRYSELEKNNRAIIDSFNSHLMESQNKWLNATRELTHNSRSLIQLISKSNANFIHDRRFQRIKKRTQKYEKLVKKELDELLNQSQDLSVFDKPSNNEASYSASATPNVSQRNITTFVTIDEFVPINYVSLIRDFKSMTDLQKVSVLQGLSWRIIKSKNKWIRRQTIVGLMVNDVLGIVNGDIQILLFNKVLMIHMVKLFLFISEDSYGRKVLFRNGGLYKELIDLMPETIADHNFICLEMVLEILLNIWHNRQILIELINLNIIDIFINTLLQIEQVMTNDQILEFIATMLLNATATEEGLDAFQYQVDVFYYLCEAFKVANDTNRNLIGAIIYALLGRKNLWKLAHKANLPEFIDDLVRIDERSNKQQLKLIKAKLHSFEPGKTMESDEFEDNESEDSNLEEENFQRNQDELTDLEEYIKGHDMLSAKYPLKQKEAEKQIEEINKIMNQNRIIITTVLNQPPAIKAQIKQEEKKKDANVKLPEIKKKKEQVQLFNPKLPGKYADPKEHYSYKSPGFKNYQEKNVNSMQVESIEPQQTSKEKYRVTSFDDQKEERRTNRVQTTKPQQKSKQNEKKLDVKQKNDKKSSQKPEYRIKKSISVEKGLGNPYRKELAYESNKNTSNVADYKSPESLKSPPPKKSKEEVLRQLNQQLRAQKKAEEQQRKLSSRNNLPANPNAVQRQNTHLKKNNFVGGTEEIRAFESKPKLRRTPPKDDEES